MNIHDTKSKGKRRSRVELFTSIASLLEQTAAAYVELAEQEAKAETDSPAGWRHQNNSPIGKRKHLELWRRLRDAKAAGVRAAGKLRLIRDDVFEAALTAAEDTPRRHHAEPANDLAAAFGVLPSRAVGGAK